MANMGSSLTDFVRFRPHTYARTQQSLPPLWESIIKVNIRDTVTVNATCSQLTIKTRNQHLKRRFFSIWVFFCEHSRFTGQQGMGEGVYLTPLYHFHPLHRHLDISWAITTESSPLHIASSQTRTGNLWFPSASC